MSDKKTYPPHTHIQNKAHINSIDKYEQLYTEAEQHNDAFWAEQAQQIDWFKGFHTVKQADFHSVDISWFLGGQLNACYNCVDRHVKNGKGSKTAIIWAKDEPGQYEHISYDQVLEKVCQISNMLKSHGVKKGDRVCIYMPMVPEAVFSMLACARIGVVHSVVFAGFSSEALYDRIIDSDSKVLLTANEGCRGGKTIPLKQIVDQALVKQTPIQSVFVFQRTPTMVPMQNGRDYNFEHEMNRQSTQCEIEWMDSEDPLFILYTSGSTGKPKGLLHTTAGYLVYTACTHQWVFNYRDQDIYCCAADIGWITGHSYIVYGPMANAATTVMFESTPIYPDPGRYWQLVEDLKINTFYTAPTALRAIAPNSEQWLNQYDLSSLQILGSVGEPINPETWTWYYEQVGHRQCAVVDTWWQTETGGILISPLPGATPTKPGSATKPLFGIKPVLIDKNKQEVKGSGEGALCISQSWPGQARTIYKDHERFKQTYFSEYPGYYFTGDAAKRDQDGYYWVTGRMDDVMNVSGHRLGTAEIEGALLEHQNIAESAVVAMPHSIKGQAIYAYVVLKDSNINDPWETIVKQHVQDIIGAFAKPQIVHLCDALPKTRSGKVMRRILRKIAERDFESLGDTSTLANPECVENLIAQRQNL